ncbi:hypothetical protein JCM18882A_28150 [Brevibacterium metallidurans]|uniref:Uncharacterized protein n=1 Tax=Brevibacterium metallidurans TaxID=1482676 RepID=A0ABP3CC37_9MICO
MDVYAERKVRARTVGGITRGAVDSVRTMHEGEYIPGTSNRQVANGPVPALLIAEEKLGHVSFIDVATSGSR